MANPLIEIQMFGQSIWYDNIRRGLITSGELARMVDEDGLLGVTSNPSIFEKAIAGSADYDPATKALIRQSVGDAKSLYERLAMEDIQLACDVMYPVYLRTEGRDGLVSFEVSPYLAHDTQGTIDEARRLHAAIGRDNVMIKVPATSEGLPAITELLGQGISVNVTLLFSLEVYLQVAKAYLNGLEKWISKGGDPKSIASVASFFVSRVDSLIDDRLGRELDETKDAARRHKLKSLIGRVAISNAITAYDEFQKLLASDRWKDLSARGARPQRLLWASTSTKNPKYPATMYVDELIAPDTVNTVPAETFELVRGSQQARVSLTDDWPNKRQQAQDCLNTLAEVGISLREATTKLLAEGVSKFSEAFDKLIAAVEKKRQALTGGGAARQSFALGNQADAVHNALDQWRAAGNVHRLWNQDPTLWTGTDENKWLGWLRVVDEQRDHSEHLRMIADDVRQAGFKHALLLGMGGSSLCPEVLHRTFGPGEGFPQLLVLDSMVPAQVARFTKAIDPAQTIFIVSSKSGTTIEPNVLKQYFMRQVEQAIGLEEAGSHFIAITDPHTKMNELAKAEHFRHIFFGLPSIGGRYSAMSNFGMVPAAIMGLDVPEFLARTEVMVQACASCVPPELNPGVSLGAALGTLAKAGRDKVTIASSPAIGSLGLWLEQLIAESTGKQGRGLVPIAEEKLGPPGVYGNDRVFCYIRLDSAPSSEQDAAIDALEAAGHHVVRIRMAEKMDLGQEFFRWEIATAVAGSIIGINAFNQPDVEAAKVAARNLTSAYEKSGKLPDESPVLEDQGLRLFADPRNANELAQKAAGKNAKGYLTAHLSRLVPGDYFAITAYVDTIEPHELLLQEIRHTVRDARKVATTMGYGPRFLHSTGQLHKGGPNSGVFLQITSDDQADVEIPGQRFTFGVLKRAQAQGDFEVLAERGRRLLRVHLPSDVQAGLTRLRDLIVECSRAGVA